MAEPPPNRAIDPVDPQAEDVAPSELITVEPAGTGGAIPGLSVGSWGRYRLDRRVGDGGFGSVYLGWDPDLELEVAIKILHRRIADARLKAALLQEGRALAKVHHPHVVRVLAVESHEDQIGLCMEFVRGETLEVLVRRGGPMDG